ncbi:protein of unknown function [Tepidibacter aestuarii]|nr:protein of unknown function [Tepidibacter aestuarii]
MLRTDSYRQRSLRASLLKIVANIGFQSKLSKIQKLYDFLRDKIYYYVIIEFMFYSY